MSQRTYANVPFGYARGWEPVLYVDNIRAYYNILKWLTANEEAEMREFEVPEELADPVEEPAAEVERT